MAGSHPENWQPHSTANKIKFLEQQRDKLWKWTKGKLDKQQLQHPESAVARVHIYDEVIEDLQRLQQLDAAK